VQQEERWRFGPKRSRGDHSVRRRTRCPRIEQSIDYRDHRLRDIPGRADRGVTGSPVQRFTWAVVVSRLVVACGGRDRLAMRVRRQHADMTQDGEEGHRDDEKLRQRRHAVQRTGPVRRGQRCETATRGWRTPPFPSSYPASHPPSYPPSYGPQVPLGNHGNAARLDGRSASA